MTDQKSALLGRHALNLSLKYSTPAYRKPRYEASKLNSPILFRNNFGTEIITINVYRTVQRVETFFKKTHNSFQAKYFDSEYAIQAKNLLSVVQIVCNYSDSYYLQRAEELSLTSLEKQLLTRDINELRQINSPGFQMSLQKESKCIRFPSFFLAADHIMRKNASQNDDIVQLSILIQKIRCLSNFQQFATDFMQNKKACPDEYLKAERLVHNLYFKILLYNNDPTTTALRSTMLSFYFFSLKHSAPALPFQESDLKITRILREVRKFQKNAPPQCLTLRSSYDLRTWTGVIFGEKGTPLEGAIYYIIVKMPSEYPFVAPVLRFVNQVFNPGVSADGTKIVVDVLTHKFSPIVPVISILESISRLLHDVGVVDTYEIQNPEAQGLFVNNKAEFEKRVKEFVVSYA